MLIFLCFLAFIVLVLVFLWWRYHYLFISLCRGRHCYHCNSPGTDNNSLIKLQPRGIFGRVKWGHLSCSSQV
ncbi:hypothetical protein L204_100039 [Cryptococcus depauperatus]